MKKLVPVILASIYLLTFSFWSGMVDKADAAFTATLSFASPADGGSTSLNASGQFSIDVMVNTGGQATLGADANLFFDNTKLDFVASASTWGNFYNAHGNPQVNLNCTSVTNGFCLKGNKITAGVYNTSGFSTNSGKIANLVFSTKTGVTLPTTAAFSFQFIGASVANTTDSNVLIINSGGDPEDILNAVTNATITINAYVPPVATPLITSLNPNNGALAGGYDVVINGDATRNFGTTTGTVTWNGVTRPLKTGTSWSATQLTVVAPVGTTSGAIPVTVTNATTGLISTAVNFTYNAPPASTDPDITGLSVHTGSTVGGETVTITGANFGTNEGSVTIGGTTVSPSVVTWTSATSITFTTPAHAAGDVYVIVAQSTVDGGKSTSSTDAQANFTYITPSSTVDPTNPDISYLSPVSGRADQDVTVTIYGSNFLVSGSSVAGTVRFGTFSANITSWTNGTIVVRAPQLGVILADVPYTVTVTRTDGKSDTAYYTYTAPPSTGGTGTPGGTTTTPGGGNTTTPKSGMPTGAWAGIISANGILAFLIKRRLF